MLRTEPRTKFSRWSAVRDESGATATLVALKRRFAKIYIKIYAKFKLLLYEVIIVLIRALHYTNAM